MPVPGRSANWGEKTMNWMMMPLRRYADFSGRSRRKEYWMFVLLNVLLALIALAALAVSYYADMSESAMTTLLTPLFVVYFLLSLAFIIPGLAVTVRRLHDTDRSGWTILFGLIPIVGPFLLLVYYISEGTSGPNRFGEDPKAHPAA
jgi:uncharacterized membrane protein YhaH (DUF805 family)